jgi:acetyl esterase/lipase
MSTKEVASRATGSRPTTFFARQPGKALWILLALTTTAIRFPLFAIYYIPKSLRPVSKWTWRQAISTAMMKLFLYHYSAIEFKVPTSLHPGVEKDDFVVMKPSKDVYKGVLIDSEIKPEDVGGTWYPNRFQDGDEKKRVLLHFHGGAYILGTGRKGEVAQAARVLSKYLAPKVFYLQYRLSCNPGGRFPAALQDAVTSYQYLLDLGIPASSIIVSGDSAGANLCLAFLRYISDHKDLMPAPGAALLWSPWVNLVAAREHGAVERNPRYGSDYLTTQFAKWGADTYVPEFMDASDGYISPYDKPFTTETPLWIQTCGAEVLADDDRHLADRMKGVTGNQVVFYEEPDAPHDLLAVGFMIGMEKELVRITESAKEFLDKYLKG